MDKKVYCLIMAGGEGKRFWPKGKKGLPKQFFAVDGKRSMVEITFKRMKKLVCEEKIFIVTNKKQSVLMKKEMSFLNQNSFILEPFGRNTAAAIGLAALYLQLKDPRAVMLVSPCDHFVRNNKKFSQAVNLAIKTAACNNLLVTIGIQPTYPNAEYGYIKIRKPQTNPSPKDKPAGQGGIVRGRQKIEDKKRDERDDIFRVERFTEKPDRKTAGGFLKNGNYLWNSGIFAWKAQVILDAIARYMPELFKALSQIKNSPGQERILNRAYRQLRPIPIDSGVIERAKNVVSLKAGFQWDDLGHWRNARKYAKDFRIRYRTKKNRPGLKR